MRPRKSGDNVHCQLWGKSSSERHPLVGEEIKAVADNGASLSTASLPSEFKNMQIQNCICELREGF